MISRADILKQLRNKCSSGQPLSTGFATRQSLADTQQPDVSFLFHTGGLKNIDPFVASLLPLDDANAAVLELASEAISFPEETFVIAGVCGTDPFRMMDKLLEQIKSLGFAGVQNFPSLGLMDSSFRAHLERSNIGYAKEVEMIRIAREMDIFTMPLVFSSQNAAEMLKAGADVLIVHPGAKAFLKNSTGTEIPKAVAEIAADARSVRRDAFIFFPSTSRELVPI